LRYVWKGDTIEEGLRRWCENETSKESEALPLIIAWGIWFARNANIFEDMNISPLKCVV